MSKLYAKLNINLYYTLAFNVLIKSKISIHIIFADNTKEARGRLSA